MKKIREFISPIPRTKNLSDDILVHGKTKAEHDQSLWSLFKLLDSKNATINTRKLIIDAPEIEFFGLIFSGKGIKPQQSKIDAIKNASPPKTATEVRSLLGLATFIARFIADYATITEPLWNLTRSNVRWNWTNTHQQSLDKLKNAISDKTLAYFRTDFDTVLIVDASPVGLAGILIQENPKNSCDVERRYSQVEKEALSVVWNCERNHLFIFAKTVTIVTDNKAVELIFKNPKSNPPARIQRWVLRLSHPVEEYINFLEETLVPDAISINQLRDETKKDPTLQTVIKIINKEPYTDSVEIKKFQSVIESLTVTNNGLILKNNQLVIPSSLQQKVVNIAHEGHLGIAKTKALLREKVWFQEINKKVEDVNKNCIACLASTKQDENQNIHLSEMPTEPWEVVAVDFYGPTNNVYLLVLICLYSRFIVVEKINSTAHTTVTKTLNSIFSILGIPSFIKSDNGPPFNSFQFARFTQYLGVKHLKITPLWPQANGMVERFMKSISKSIQAATIENKQWEIEISKLVKSHNNTPHCTTGVTPNSLIFKYRAKSSRLPCYRPPKINERNRFKERVISLYDTVLVKQKQINKQTSYYNPNPYIVTKMNGTMVTAFDNKKNHKVNQPIQCVNISDLFTNRAILTNRKVNDAESMNNVTSPGRISSNNYLSLSLSSRTLSQAPQESTLTSPINISPRNESLNATHDNFNTASDSSSTETDHSEPINDAVPVIPLVYVTESDERAPERPSRVRKQLQPFNINTNKSKSYGMQP
ncbi:unnamed protein product [Brachionus calyciflorus]|uniref:Integrase catalytic domain-containing protein n=1 Tax=Brachionus calyciflorus TaxID=104777 RepID=A0A813NXL8_9BILA|nr:unnamed protein product [Brachionus calyciflorus]